MELNKLLSAAVVAGCGLSFSACDGGADTRINALEQRVEDLEKARKPAMRPKEPPAIVDIPFHAEDPYRGAADAKVTIVEAFEFACAYCAMVEPLMVQVLEKYEGRPVRIVPKQFVVHPDIATLPALATCAAHRLGAYEPYTKALWKRSWKNEGRLKLDRAALSREALLDLATEVGLDRTRFTAELDGATCKRTLERDRVELAKAGVRGTPTLFVNGRRYAGPRTVEGLSRVIDGAL